MPRPLVDLLWRRHPEAPAGGSRGPRSKVSVDEVVDAAITLADRGGISEVTIRNLAKDLGISTMSVYTHVNDRDDLLALMVDEMHCRAELASYGRAQWRIRVRRVAETNLELLRNHSWLLEIDDPRTALGPGTIAKYDHELHAFDGMGLDHLTRDSALSFVLDFAHASAARMVLAEGAGEFSAIWEEASGRLADYLGRDHPLAQEVGRVSGEAMGSPYDAGVAWEFGMRRVLAGLAEMSPNNS
jgi:AcrR family transcriptional regulator